MLGKGQTDPRILSFPQAQGERDPCPGFSSQIPGREKLIGWLRGNTGIQTPGLIVAARSGSHRRHSCGMGTGRHPGAASRASGLPSAGVGAAGKGGAGQTQTGARGGVRGRGELAVATG